MEIDTNTSISSSGHIDPAASTSTSVPVFGECPGVSPGISSTIGVSCSTVPMVIAPTEEVTESTDISKLCPEKGIQTDVVPTTPSQNIRYVGDLEPLHFASPRKAKRHLEFVKEVVQEQKKKIRKLHDQEKALKQHIHSLQNLLDHLMEKNILSEHAAASIKDETPSTIQNILRRQLQSKNRKYLPGLRAFALTLHFYSSNAYNYVRRQFNNLLPHPETIRQWYAVLDGRPGFTKEAFEAIRVKQESDKVIINLVIDEISIHQQIQWQGGQYHGYVEFGNDILGDSDLPQEARNALVFMAVALNSHWKITLGYFLINTLNSKERANLLTTCLDLLSETGASCHSVTYDGAPVNISMCTALGANYNRDNFKPWFLHKNTAGKVHTIWDACHMIKLARSALGDKKIIYNSKGEAIEWKYIEMLHELSPYRKPFSRHV
ncbi:hypothetical protein NQ317_006928 [Molorchus minor]|uniref:CARD domain-containing protein n=1 Tax=Molorchus minor TaxID=1323400 RepID=A0ABQ9IT00_9CUCU|nr:hypothetical protein NQ317_006928 [Molorchus minor]